MRKVLLSVLAATSVIVLSGDSNVVLPEIPAAPANGPEHWRGLNVAILGDSISDKFQTSKQRVWWQYLGSWLGWDVHPHAIPGNQWGAIDKQIDCMLRDKGGNPQSVFILCGTNDYAGNVPLGEWFEEEEARVKWWNKESTLRRRVPCRDMKTLRGRINVCLERIKRSCPSSQIVLLTPFHRGATLKMPGEDAPNGDGVYLDAYVEVVREAGSVWSVPVVDLYSTLGILPMLDEHVQYIRDGEKDRLHPNSEGHLRIAKTVYYALNALPATF